MCKQTHLYTTALVAFVILSITGPVLGQAPSIVITDATTAQGLGGYDFYGESNHALGLVWIDYNNDGWDDLFVVNGMRGSTNLPYHLFRNDAGSLTNVDNLLPPDPALEMMGAVYADYDNDGDKDIYVYIGVPNRGSIQGDGSPPNQLLKNLWVENGNQTIPGLPLFEDVAAFAGVDDLMPTPGADGPSFVTTSATWLDYDRDGHVDLYVGHWSPVSEAQKQDRLFRNLGNGQFQDVSTAMGIDLVPRDALVTIAGHLDSNLWPDIYVGNNLTFGQDQLYDNLNGTGFVDVIGNSPGVGDDSPAAMGLALGDIELDGDFDVYVTDQDSNSCPGTNSFYENLGGPGILLADDSSCTRGITSGNSWGTNFMDMDNDGYEELFVSRITSFSHSLYRNARNGTFTQVGVPAKSGAGRGSAVSDFDHDGDLDIVVVNNDGPLQLLQNDTAATYNWVQFDLSGSGQPGGSNSSAIGTLVRVTAGGKTMLRQVLGGSSARSQDSLRLHFGLENATTVDLVEIFWPSGIVDDSRTDLAVNQVYMVAENASIPTVDINLPADGAVYVDGDTIDFDGSANDNEDGDITAALSWTSSLDGSIGSGGSFSAVLSVGTHVITAMVTDSDGDTGSATIVVTVTPVGGATPTVSITSPADGSTFSNTDSINFAGTASDLEDGNLTASLSWVSNLSGQIGTGGNFTTNLSAGAHTITASATDSNINTGSSSITVTVTDPGTAPTEVTFYSIGVHDGTVFESSENSSVGNRINFTSSTGSALQVGDRNDDTQTRVVVSFDTSSIPEGAWIQNAELRLRRGQVFGTDPFTTHGNALADIRTGTFGADLLESTDFEAAATAVGVAQLSSAPANFDYSVGVLDPAGLTAINRDGLTQMRVYFELDDDDDNLRDAIGYFSGDNSDPENRPQLVVTYKPDILHLSAARQWSEVLLEAIRGDFARPTVHARNLYHTSVAMWDAWAAYDGTAAQVLHQEQATAADVEAARAEAISYAAYRLLSWRFANSPSAIESLQTFDDKMDAMGYDRGITTTVGDTPAALGNRIAETLINFGLTDGSNESGGFENLIYEPINPPLLPDFPGNPDLLDPNRWQPLALEFFIDQSGNVIPGGFPDFLSPEWGIVEAFALSIDDLNVYQRDGYDWFVFHDPGPPPPLGTPEYSSGFEQVVEWSGALDPADGVMIDISPASRGNNTLGTNDGTGHPINPVTGLPYTPQFVPAGDYYRVLAEFWADGPASETPPGHWFTIANYVSDHPLVVKRLGGVGPVLGDLEWDVKVYLALGGAMHDSAVSAWGVKGWYDYIRPVSAIRHLCDNGQSSDPGLPSYDVNGIHLKPDHIELVTDVTTAPGGKHEHLAGPGGENIGKIAVYAWRGPDYIFDPDTDVAGVGWILCENWWPYQRPSFVTPPFAGYVSGHSTFSRAAAEVMTLLTGDEYFPGGMGEFLAPQNEFLVFEDGPSVDVTLQWATYPDASDETSISRIYGGIHPTADDIPGRLMGYVIGPNAFYKALEYFEGTVGSAPTVTITDPADGFSVESGTAIDFAGTADDTEDGDLTASLDWTSDLDGAIGTGGAFTTTLSEGIHMVTAAVTDSDGNTRSDTIMVSVSPLGGFPPTVTITAPADGSSFLVTDTIDFAGTADDIEDGNLTANLDWTSDLDGAIGTGGAFSTPLSQGVHVITASVDDSDGNNGSDVIGLTVSVGGGSTEVTFESVALEDGTVFESGEDTNVGNKIANNGSPAALQIGDQKNDIQTRVIVSFDTSSLPDGAIIQSAVLRMRRGRLLGTDPFTTHGSCWVDVQTGGFSGNPALEVTDFEAPATVGQAASLSGAAADLDWSEGSLDPAGLTAVNTIGVTQMRIYFDLDDNDDGGRDAMGYISGNDSDPANRPQLVITYTE